MEINNWEIKYIGNGDATILYAYLKTIINEQNEIQINNLEISKEFG